MAGYPRHKIKDGFSSKLHEDFCKVLSWTQALKLRIAAYESESLEVRAAPPRDWRGASLVRFEVSLQCPGNPASPLQEAFAQPFVDRRIRDRLRDLLFTQHPHLQAPKRGQFSPTHEAFPEQTP